MRLIWDSQLGNSKQGTKSPYKNSMTYIWEQKEQNTHYDTKFDITGCSGPFYYAF